MVAGFEQLLPDRALLPRRGPARRPPAGVHAARPRDELRRAGGRAGAHRGAVRDDGGARPARPQHASAVPAHHVRRVDAALRHRQARPALRARARRLHEPRARDGVRRVQSAVDSGGSVEGICVPGGAAFSRKETRRADGDGEEPRREGSRVDRVQRRAGRGDRRDGEVAGAEGAWHRHGQARSASWRTRSPAT